MTVPAAAVRQLTVEQAARQLSVHPETIRRAIRKGELKASRNRLAPGGPLLIGADVLAAFVTARTA
ncbi:MAG TPA: helix-turn-helix domain-containing protein [Nocardioides sp.]|nr:helix-turn-helix domain-containing protein [Nocardioides sp.]